MSEEKGETAPETTEKEEVKETVDAPAEEAKNEKNENNVQEDKKEDEEKKEEDNNDNNKEEEDNEESEHLLLDKEVDFDRPEGYVFKEEENVYVIDPNGYDMWEAQISKIVADNYAVHYPDYPDDDEELNGTDRLLAATEKNKDLYQRMENNRQKNRELKEKRKNQRRGKKQKKNKKKEQGIRHNPLRGPTIVKKNYY